MPLKSNQDGSYVASWVPSASGHYVIQIWIDGKEAGGLSCDQLGHHFLSHDHIVMSLHGLGGYVGVMTDSS